MSNINENIAENIKKLRKTKSWKQSDLADALNYSDKTISKWERCESVPDLESLSKISEIFNVSIDYLTKEHSEREIQYGQDKGLFTRNLLIMILYCVTIYMIATALFVISVLRDASNAHKWWLIFVFGSPICSLITAIYGRRNRYWLVELISLSCFIWLLITSFFCMELVIYNAGYFSLLYIIGVPIQAAVCLYFFWKRNSYYRK